MSMKISDPIRGKSRGTAEQAIANVDRPDERDKAFLRALYEYAPVVNIDACIPAAHTGQETAGLTSARWRHGDPAGIGIPHDDTPEPFSYTGGENSALVYLTCLNRLVEGTMPEPWLDQLTVDQRRWIDTVWKRHCNQARAAGVRVITVDHLNERYRADGDNHATWAWNANAANEIVAWGNRLFPNLPDAQEEPMADLTFGNVPKPTIIPMIVQKPPYNAGYTLVAPRRVLGACRHITDGLASLEWYAEFFGPGGQRYLDALTDFGIDQQGRIAMWNDPFGTRAPWASGGSDGLEGDGPLFVRTLGVGMINAGLASVEHVQRAPGKLTDAQLESSARLLAWLFDGASNHPRGSKVPWHAFPLNPNVGCVTDMEHWEFATKSCPAAGIISQRDALQNRIRALMKKGQEGESQGEIPPPDPVNPDHDRYPAGMDRGIAALRFGTMRLHRPGRRVGGFGFHEGHAVCEAWLERGEKEGAWPAGADWYQFADAPGITRHVVSFASGWILWRANAREGWRWIG